MNFLVLLFSIVQKIYHVPQFPERNSKKERRRVGFNKQKHPRIKLRNLTTVDDSLKLKGIFIYTFLRTI